ncbi:16S rRNA (guanine(527)-N(7))-methyltransferase RsmG [Candidatus Solincola tengchongensis]|uniref:16S rRNA (guanine(527)-N(7))-methyltransferase RsmG n=1 Tax=Candidatus Solincola tengchongensis TaxID=2900693 RepID=UPI00257CEF6B
MKLPNDVLVKGFGHGARRRARPCCCLGTDMGTDFKEIIMEEIEGNEKKAVVDKADMVFQSLRKAAGRLNIDISQEKLDMALAYLEELMRWNRAFNLVGRRLDLEGILTLFIDSLTPLAVRGISWEDAEVLDIGSGAGMPGIPLYIFGGPFSLTMLESQRKKITFIRHICQRLGLAGAGVYPGRLEEMRREEDFISGFDIGLARAVMNPEKLVRMASPLVSEGGKLILFLGKGDAETLRRNSLDWERRGWKLEGIKSTRRFVGRENYLAILRKAS